MHRYLMLILLLGLLTACSGSAATGPTQTLQPTAPAITDTQIPSVTPEPTVLPTNTPLPPKATGTLKPPKGAFRVGENGDVERWGGYAWHQLQPPKALQLEYTEPPEYFTDEDRKNPPMHYIDNELVGEVLPDAQAIIEDGRPVYRLGAAMDHLAVAEFVDGAWWPLDFAVVVTDPALIKQYLEQLSFRSEWPTVLGYDDFPIYLNSMRAKLLGVRLKEGYLEALVLLGAGDRYAVIRPARERIGFSELVPHDDGMMIWSLEYPTTSPLKDMVRFTRLLQTTTTDKPRATVQWNIISNNHELTPDEWEAMVREKLPPVEDLGELIRQFLDGELDPIEGSIGQAGQAESEFYFDSIFSLNYK